ncbi:MAG: DUF2914 domain-containing protein [Gemmatimonadota bacterium]|jgi:hypothetical protein
MRRSFLALTALALAAAVARPAAAQQATPDTAGITVSQAVAATGVENRQPTGVAEQFPADVGTVYCYMVAEGDFPETQLVQVWMHGDQEMAKVPLTVKGPRWRTWSSKKIMPDWTGDWTVRIEDASGNVLKSVSFTIGSAGGPS